MQTIQTKHNPEKNDTKHSKTKLHWLSRLLRHWIQCAWAHMGLEIRECICIEFL